MPKLQKNVLKPMAILFKSGLELIGAGETAGKAIILAIPTVLVVAFLENTHLLDLIGVSEKDRMKALKLIFEDSNLTALAINKLGALIDKM